MLTKCIKTQKVRYFQKVTSKEGKITRLSSKLNKNRKKGMAKIIFQAFAVLKDVCLDNLKLILNTLQKKRSNCLSWHYQISGIQG